MSSILYGLGRASFRRRGVVLIAWLIVLLGIGGSAAAFSQPFEDSFQLPGTESQQGLDMLSNTFPQVSGSSAQIIVVAPEGDDVDDAQLKAAIELFVDRVADLEGVEAAVSPFDDNIDGAISEDRSAALISVQMAGEAVDLPEETLAAIQDLTTQLGDTVPGSQASAGGTAFQEVTVGISWIDLIGVGVALVVLWVTLGSFRAAGLPLITALWGVAISMLAIVVGTAFMVINSTTLMLALMLGLAVGIDYALFIISRHRDQLATGMEPEESAARAVATSGSAVVFAGITVMIALAGLGVAGIPFLTTMGLAASMAVAIAVLIAITALPAFLGVMGERLRPKGAPSPTAPARRGDPSLPPGDPSSTHPAHANGAAPDAADGAKPSKPKRGKGWAARWVGAATKVPALTVAIIVIGLGALAIPASNLKLALPDSGDDPAGSPTRVTYDLISDHFGPGHNGPLLITVDIVASDDPLEVMEGIQEMVEDVPGVESVPLATPNESIDTGIVQIVPTTGPDDPATVELVHRLRELAPQIEQEYGVTPYVTGFTAMQIDVSEQLGEALVPFAVVVVGLSLVLLAIVFRSIWVPIKAAIGYLFSVITAFGVVALVFEYGYGASLLGLDQTGPVISFLPIILMGILFGLAMDYEVFLVSRIREDHVHGAGAREAIRTGFIASSRVVLAAGLIMFAVFAAFVPEGDAILKSIALGLAVGIFVDAFIVRMTLVPAVLQLLGDKAWWLPKWLDRILPSFDVEGEGLQHRLTLADWPRAGRPYGIAADGVTVGERGVLPTQGLFVEQGQACALVGGDEQIRTAALLAITGRTRITDGKLKVADLVLPQQAGVARRRTAFVDLADGGMTELSRIGGTTDQVPIVVAIDHAEQCGAHEVEQLLDLIGNLRQRGSTVLVSTSRPIEGLAGVPMASEQTPTDSVPFQTVALV